MLRMGGGGVLAVVAGAAVVLGGAWAQLQALDSGSAETPAVLVAVVRMADDRQWQLVVIDSRTDAELVLNAAGTLAVAPKWSPDGSRLVWVEFELNADPAIAQGVIWERQSGKRHRFETSFEDFQGFEWSPDSSMVADLGESLEIWDREGKVILQEPPPPPAATRHNQRGSIPPSWSPDSQQLSYLLNGVLVVWDRENGARRFNAGDFDLPRNLGEYVLAARRPGLAFVVLRPDQPAAAIELALDGTRTELPGNGLVYWQRPEFLSVELFQRFGEVAVAPGVSADGRAKFGFWTPKASSGTAYSDGGVLVVGRGWEFERRLEGLERLSRSRDVVLVGDWPVE